MANNNFGVKRRPYEVNPFVPSVGGVNGGGVGGAGAGAGTGLTIALNINLPFSQLPDIILKSVHDSEALHRAAEELRRAADKIEEAASAELQKR